MRIIHYYSKLFTGVLRLAAFTARVPEERGSALVPGGRAVLPYENAEATARRLAEFFADAFD